MVWQDWGVDCVSSALLLCWPIVNHFTPSLSASHNTAMNEAVQISRVVPCTRKPRNQHTHTFAKGEDVYMYAEVKQFNKNRWLKVTLSKEREEESPAAGARESRGKKTSHKTKSDERKRCLLLVIVRYCMRSKLISGWVDVWRTGVCDIVKKVKQEQRQKMLNGSLPN